MSNNPAVFLDRDGVLIEELDFNVNPEKIYFLPTVLKALTSIPKKYLKIIVSNQSGVGRGYFSNAEVDRFNQSLLNKIKKTGASVDKIYYCPHAPDMDCHCRKPKPGLFDYAHNEFGIDFDRSWMIGDKSTDILAGQNIGAKTILVKTGYGGKEPGFKEVKPDYIVGSLSEAVEIIKNDAST